MILSNGAFSFPAVIHVVTVFTPGPNMIQGPDTACTNSTYPYIYSVPFVNGATYSWTTAHGTVVGLSTGNIFTISYTSFAIGYDTISVLCTSSGCTFISTLIVLVSNPHDVALILEPYNLCDDETILLSGGTPPGGIYVINGTATDSARGLVLGTGQHLVTYYYTDGFGCFAEATDTLTVNFCLSTNEFAGDAGITVFPNPVSGSVTIGSRSSHGEHQAINSVSIFNMLGEELISVCHSRRDDPASACYLPHTADVSALLPGIYFLKISLGNKILVTKLVKE
jgi:hypothetical protein